MSISRCLHGAAAVVALCAAAAAQDENPPTDAQFKLQPSHVLGDARLRHAADVTHIATLTGGRRVLSTARDGSVRLWDLTNGRELRRFHHPDGEDVWNAVLLPGEREFLSCGEDRHVTRWNLETGEIVQRYKMSTTVMRLAMAPDGKHFVACDSGKRASLWSMETGERVRTFNGHRESVYSAIITPDGKTLITGSEDGSIRGWQIATGKSLWTIEKADEEEEQALPVPPGGADPFGAARPPAKLPKKDPGPGHHGDVFTLCLLPGGEQFASCSADHTVALWNTADGSPVWKVELPESVTVIAPSPDGKRLAATCHDRRIYVLRCSDGKRLRSMQTPKDYHWPVAWSVDGKRLISGGDHLLHQWDAATGKQLFPPPANEHVKGAIARIAVSPDGRRLYAAGEDEQIYVWDLEKRAIVERFKALDNVRSLQLSPDGARLLVAGSEQIALFDTKDFHAAVHFNVDNSLRSAAWADGGKMIVASNWQGELLAWNPADGRPIYAYNARQDSGENVDYEAIIVSPDGRRFVAMDDDGFVDVRKTADASRLASIGRDLGDSLAAALLLPDEQALLVFGGRDESARMFAFAPPISPHAKPLDAGAIRNLARQLGDDDFLTREAATMKLMQGGKNTLKVLATVRDDDSEVRWRLARIRDGVRDGRIPTKLLECRQLPLRVQSAAAHPTRAIWAMAMRYDCQAIITLGRLDGGRTTFGPPVGDGHSPVCLAFSPNGKHLYAGNRDGTISAYDVPQ